MKIVVIGEGMLELSQQASGDGWRVGYGGDTLNTAIHLSRLGRKVAYATALGIDSFSDDLRRAWGAEGIDTSLILTDSSRQPGLYAIHTDHSGERSFSYWRNDSAARQLFELPDSAQLIAAASNADLLYYSMITLAILPPTGRNALLKIANAVRARGGRVAFDSNYRPNLWRDVATAQNAHDTALACCDIGLPTLEDEMLLSGTLNAEAVADQWRRHGAAEVVVKLGARGCAIDGRQLVSPPTAIYPIDTSGAGDAFNAGYLHARIDGATPEQAALAGHRLAGWTITQRGAIPARTEDAPYR